RPPAVLAGTEITALLESADGTVWVGASSGLHRLAPAAATVERISGFTADPIHSLFEDAKGRVWAPAAAGTIVVVSATGLHVLDRRHGLPQHALYRVIEDASGNYWLSSGRGIFELKRGPLEAVLAGARQSLEVVLHGQDDGMRTIECHGLSQPSGGRDRDGGLWFPTARGFIRIRPQPARARPAPRVVIEEHPGAVLPPGTRNVELRFTALRLSTPGKVRFRYRMTGYDPDWVDAGAERTARYNQLPAGPHRFEVQARDPEGEWSPAAAVTLDQQPRFSETWWFAALLGAGLVGAAAGVHRWRLHAIRGRYAAVVEERNRIGREWHDTLVAGFSAISLQIEAALASIAHRPDRASDILDMTRRMVHHYRAEARRVIWDLRDDRPEGETLPMAVENALRRVIENQGIEGAVSSEGAPVELPADLQHNVLRICQEAMSNSARHGNPSRIDVRLVFAPGELKAVVSDNGCGFRADRSSAVAAGHFGLTVMQERARRHGGSLRIESQSGRGTTVETVIPLHGGRE
ncbi:MAG TPA: hypothetical protein DEH78_27990, partial [Solibacterales bacterium]|nr:hypothetical protein [Bryobacterales bacterium]